MDHLFFGAPWILHESEMRKKVLDDQVGAFRAVLRARFPASLQLPAVQNSGGGKWNFLSVCALFVVRQSLLACHFPRPGSCSVLGYLFPDEWLSFFILMGWEPRWRTRAVCEGEQRRYSTR